MTPFTRDLTSLAGQVSGQRCREYLLGKCAAHGVEVRESLVTKVRRHVYRRAERRDSEGLDAGAGTRSVCAAVATCCPSARADDAGCDSCGLRGGGCGVVFGRGVLRGMGGVCCGGRAEQIDDAWEWYRGGEEPAGLMCSDGETMLCRVPVSADHAVPRPTRPCVSCCNTG